MNRGHLALKKRLQSYDNKKCNKSRFIYHSEWGEKQRQRVCIISKLEQQTEFDNSEHKEKMSQRKLRTLEQVAGRV